MRAPDSPRLAIRRLRYTYEHARISCAQVWYHLGESEELERGKYLEIVTMLLVTIQRTQEDTACTADVHPSVFVLLMDLTTHDDLSSVTRRDYAELYSDEYKMPE